MYMFITLAFVSQCIPGPGCWKARTNRRRGFTLLLMTGGDTQQEDVLSGQIWIKIAIKPTKHRQNGCHL